jgi:hypothetical protein
LVAGDQAPSASGTPFPQLKIASPSDAFHVALEGQLDFDSASKQVAAQLVGRKYPFLDNKYWIKIEKASVYGTGDVAVVQLGISGDLNGTIYLTGTPQYDSGTDILTVPNLDYSLDTKNILAKVADWLLHARFQDSIAQQAHWSLGGRIGALKGQLESALNGTQGGVVLTGHVASLRVIGVYATSTAFVARVAADGTLHATVP